MKAKRLIPIVLSLLMVGTLFAGCGGKGNGNSPETPPAGGETDTPTVTGVVASAEKTTANVGDTVNLSAQVNGTNNPSQAVTWEITEGSNLASLNGSTLTLTGEGTVKVVAKSNADPTKKSNEITITISAQQGGGGDIQQSTPLPTANRIYVVGDSTVCEYKDSKDATQPLDKYYLPRYGYGTQLAEYLNVNTDQVVNLAMSGRSSKSFITEANYTTLTSSISAGDYLIIGFGHNDEKSEDPARFTDPAGSKDAETTAKGTSLKWSLYQNYIKVAVEKGATPILCTPIVRYSSTAEYSGAKIHVTADGDYAAAIKALGEETGTTVIDLTALTKSVYEADNANAKYYHAYSTYYTASDAEIKAPNTYDGSEKLDDGVHHWADDTHINKYGAKMVAYQFANALKATDSSLKAHVKDGITAPTKEVDYVDAIWQGYVKPDYTAFDPAASADAKLTGDWYKTCMGDLGGKSTTPFTVTSSAADAFAITCINGKGKISGDNDGIACAFRQIPIGKNFTASATVTVKALGGVKQAAFGMMLRDDIYMNKTKSGDSLVLNSNYVAAGALTNEGAATTAIFSRESTALKKSSNTVTLATEQQINVSIVRVGQVVTVNFGESAQTFTDFDFRSVDSDYMYLCLFATRDFAVEFSNVKFEITTDSQGA